MRNTFLIGFIILMFLNSYAQNEIEIIEILKSTSEIGEINNKLEKYPDCSARLSFINSENDTTDFNKTALNTKVGEIFNSTDNSEFYKVVESDSSVSIRVSYIYFDGYKMDKKEIDKLRKELIKRLDNGESFSELARKYTMDGNSAKGGDFGWMNASMLDKTFVKEVLNHKKGDLFEIDVTKNNWYYLVLKTYDDKIIKTNMMIVIKSSR